MARTNGHTALKNKIKRLYKIDKRKIASAATALSHAARDAKEKFSDVEESVEKYAKTNPWKTMGLSVLAGVIVGQILHLRK